MKTFIICFIIMVIVGMHDSCPMGHHEIDCDIDPNEDEKKGKLK